MKKIFSIRVKKVNDSFLIQYSYHTFFPMYKTLLNYNKEPLEFSSYIQAISKAAQFKSYSDIIIHNSRYNIENPPKITKIL